MNGLSGALSLCKAGCYIDDQCMNHLKSLRSVQISILKPKKYIRSSKNLSVLCKNFGTLASKSFFSVKFGVVWQRCQVCYPIGIVDDFQII